MQGKTLDLDQIVNRLGEYTTNAVLICGADDDLSEGSRVLWCNTLFTQMSGYESQQVIHQQPQVLLQCGALGPAIFAEMEASLAREQPVRREIKIIRKDGSAFWADLDIIPAVDADGHCEFWIWQLHDISERKKRELNILQLTDQRDQLLSDMEHRNLHDPLTNLPNRRYVERYLEEQLQNSSVNSAAGLGLALLHIDLDRFKQINDTRGHAFGDEVLQHVSRSLKRIAFSFGSFVARSSSDEFLMVCRVAKTSNSAKELANQILDYFSKPIVINDKTCRVGASIGLALTEPGNESGHDLFIRADLALQRAKKTGKSRYSFYTSSMKKEIELAKQLADEILEALDKDQFVAYFQPIFNSQTMELASIEALARWMHPKRGILAPGYFLAAAEDLDLVGKIDEAIYTQAVLAATALRAEGVPTPQISVNVSLNRLFGSELVEEVKASTPADLKVAFELLESTFLDSENDGLNEVLTDLKAANIDLHIDDFGSGHASIIGLTRVNPRGLKIDRQLIFPIVESAISRRLVSSIVDMGRSLDVHVTAEGVETQEHAEMLRDMGCHRLQGNGLMSARPLDQLQSSLQELTKKGNSNPVSPVDALLLSRKQTGLLQPIKQTAHTPLFQLGRARIGHTEPVIKDRRLHLDDDSIHQRLTAVCIH